MFSALKIFYDRLVLGKPVLVLISILLICITSAYYAKDFKLDASADSLLLEGDEGLRIFRESSERFGTQDFLFVTFIPNQDLFSDTSLNQIRKLRDELAVLPLVDSVVSLIDIPLVKNSGSSLSDIANNYKTLNDPDVDRTAAKLELLESPIYSNLIISDDAKMTAIQLNLKNDQAYLNQQKEKNRLLIKKSQQELSPEEQIELDVALEKYLFLKSKFDLSNHENIKNVREIMGKYHQYGELHLGGLTMIADDMISFIKKDLIVFGIGVFTFMILMLSIIFKMARWVILPLSSCLIAGLIMMGILGYTGWQVTIISSNFISLMLILTMSMNVHLIVRYRQLSRDFSDKSHRELVMDTSSRMVLPCLYTALTTMIGFGSLVVSGIKPVIDFGWMMVLGLMVTFIVSFIFFPSLLVILDKPKLKVNDREETPFTSVLARMTENKGQFILAVAGILVLVSIFGITRLKVENSFINYFSDSTEIYRGLRQIDEKLGGTTPLDVIIKFDPVEEYGEAVVDEFSDFDDLFGEFEDDPADAWFTSYKIDLIKDVHNYMDSLSAVGKVLSLASVIRLAEDLNEGEEFDAFELAIINKRISPELKKSIIDPYISIEDNQARISARVQDSLPELRRNELLNKIKSDLESRFELDRDDYEITGLLVLYNNMLQSLFRSQIMTLGVVMGGIALMLCVLFRSFSLAVIGIIPNILAAAIILGLMGLLNIPLDMMTITIAAITIGIAVDNSIHYIYRFREEFPRNNKDYVSTMHYCHANIGKSVFYTAITIIIGFSILVFSNFIPTIYFGVLTALAMLIALLAALTLLPRLILLIKPFS
ncbi:MAG: efflux RND transporter permease subunit [Gammaproteobacteria bacterium]|jgi:predicted RND superfamily exporter protein